MGDITLGSSVEYPGFGGYPVVITLRKDAEVYPGGDFGHT